MRLLFDQNISYRILNHLPSDIKAKHVKSEVLNNATDDAIWEFASFIEDKNLGCLEIFSYYQ